MWPTFTMISCHIRLIGGKKKLKGAEKYGTLHEFACHPCAGAMLIFSVSFQF